MDAVLKAISHLSTALRFMHNDQGKDVEYEIGSAVKSLSKEFEKIEVSISE